MNKEPVFAIIDRWPNSFRKDFKAWVDENWNIWVAFHFEACRAYARGRRHYSARTIIEWLRHETSLRQGNADFKINGNYVPDLARLWNYLYPERSGFFEIRQMPTNVRAT